MSIDRIAPKIMINRATEFARDASAELKRNELNQNAMQKQLQNEAERQQVEVVHTNKTEHAAIQREREKEQRRQKEKEEEKKGALRPEVEMDPAKARTKLPEVKAAERIIDIRI